MRLWKEKILLVSLLTCNVVVLNIFQGNLVNMYNRLDSIPINGIEDFINTGIPVLPRSLQMELFFRNKYSPLNKLFGKQFVKRMVSLAEYTNNHSDTVISDYEKHTASGYAILTTITSARKAIFESAYKNRGSTSLVLLDIIDSSPTNMGFSVWKNSRFVAQIETFLLNLISSGLYSRWYDSSLFYRHPKNINIKKKDLHPITLKEVRLTFIELLIGLLGGVIAFVIEILWAKIKGKYVQKIPPKKSFVVNRQTL